MELTVEDAKQFLKQHGYVVLKEKSYRQAQERQRIADVMCEIRELQQQVEQAREIALISIGHPDRAENVKRREELEAQLREARAARGMTDIIERAEAAMQSVTSGPWEQNGMNGVHTTSGSCIATTHQVAGRQRKTDAEFIAWARAGIPQLLAELKAARAEAERLSMLYYRACSVDDGP